MTKTEQQIEKDREAVQKMIGAKSAMEAAIRRIDHLEAILKTVASMHKDVAGLVGEQAMLRSHFVGVGNRWTSEPSITLAKDVSSALLTLIAKETQ